MPSLWLHGADHIVMNLDREGPFGLHLKGKIHIVLLYIINSIISYTHLSSVLEWCNLSSFVCRCWMLQIPVIVQVLLFDQFHHISPGKIQVVSQVSKTSSGLWLLLQKVYNIIYDNNTTLTQKKLLITAFWGHGWSYFWSTFQLDINLHENIIVQVRLWKLLLSWWTVSTIGKAVGISYVAMASHSLAT